MKPSKFECAVLPLNSRTAVRRGQTFSVPALPSFAPVGCSGKANQNPVWSDPAATLSRYMLSGLVIQKVEAVLSDGIRTALEAWPAAPEPGPPPDPAGPRLVGTHGSVGWHLV